MPRRNSFLCVKQELGPKYALRSYFFQICHVTPLNNVLIPISGYQQYTCECHTNWEGRDCDQEIIDCRRKMTQESDNQFHCVHGKCLEDNGFHECVCDIGWENKNEADVYNICDKDEDECETGKR
jgi:hypothetical protein